MYLSTIGRPATADPSTAPGGGAPADPSGGPSEGPAGKPRRRRWALVGGNVVALGTVSLITDVSSEMVTAVLPST